MAKYKFFASVLKNYLGRVVTEGPFYEVDLLGVGVGVVSGREFAVVDMVGIFPPNKRLAKLSTQEMEKGASPHYFLWDEDADYGWQVGWKEEKKRCSGIIAGQIPAGIPAGPFGVKIRGGYAVTSQKDRVLVKSCDGVAVYTVLDLELVEIGSWSEWTKELIVHLG